MLPQFLTVIPQTRSLVLISYRAEYRRALSRVSGAQSVALGALSDAEPARWSPSFRPRSSVAGIGRLVAARAAGNAFFAEEIARDLAERSVLVGDRADSRSAPTWPRCAYQRRCRTIAARIDRLASAAKRTLAATAVIGSRFTCDLLTSLGVDPCIEG